MPLTLPAHAAAVLPFLSLPPRWRAPVALVVGAASPDLYYLVEGPAPTSHSLEGLFTVCLPAGLAALVWLELLVLPVLRQVLPTVGGVQPARLLQTAGLPRSARGWALVVASLLLGAATHVLWDGFTHAVSWPARLLYPDVRLPVAGRDLPLARVLQHASSLVGTALVVAWLARRYPRLPPVASTGSWRACGLLVLTTLAGTALRLGLRLADYRSMGALEAQLWWLFWPAVAGAVVGLTLGCLLLHRPLLAPRASAPDGC